MSCRKPCCDKPKRFAHLHQHTQYSLLDGAAKLKDLISWVKETTPEGADPAVAMTDHGNMHGAVHFYNYATSMGVKPILGYEAYVVPGMGTRRDRTRGQDGEKGIYHLTLLARDFEGYQNLCRLSSRGYTEGYYYKPRIDHELLQEHHKGVIAFSGCLGSEVQQLLLMDREDEAKERLIWYRDLFKDDYFIEIQDHGLKEQAKNNPILRSWAQELGIGMVATNDGHYVKKSDATAHETLLAIQTKATLADEKRFKFPCDEFYVKNLEEMQAALPVSEWGEEPFDNTAHIADLCNVELPVGKKRVYQMPALPIPEGRTMDEEMRVQTYQGTVKRYPQHATEAILRDYAIRSLDGLGPDKDHVLQRLNGADVHTCDIETLHIFLAFMGTIWEKRGKEAGEKFTPYPVLDTFEAEENLPEYAEAMAKAAGEEDVKAHHQHALKILRRAEYELSVINNMGFPDYFLIVADYINWAKDKNISVGPGRGCLAPSVPIRMADGTTKAISEIGIGEHVLTRDGSAQKVLDTFEYDCNEELLKITCYNGDREGVTLTKDHEVLAEKMQRVPEYDGWAASTKRSRRSIQEPTGQLEWMRADKLAAGDWLFVPTPQVKEVQPTDIDLTKWLDEAKGIELSPDGQHILEYTLNKLAGTRTLRAKLPTTIQWNASFVHFLGLFAGDGWLRDQKSGRNRDSSFEMAFHSDEEQQLGAVESLMQELGVPTKRSKHAKTKMIQLEVRSRILRKVIRQLFDEYVFTSQSKHVPQCLMNAPLKLVESFLEGLIASDGHIAPNKVRITTTSIKMAEQVRFLLLRLGIPSSLGRETRHDTRPQFAGICLSYTVDFAPNKRFSGTAAKNIWTYRPTKGGLLLKLKDIQTVKSTGKVYDLKVNTNHNYLTSSFVVHNSGAGSIVAYALRITNLDPLEFNLLFERFLNPDRVSMPDFDIDFNDARRIEVIEYVQEKYGEEKVAQIATFGTMASKACLKDVARVMSLEYAKVDKVSKLIPVKFGRSYSLKDAREAVPDIAEMLEADAKLKEAYEFAQQLEGLTRHASVHAAGVVIGKTELTDLVPLMRDTSGEGVVCQYDMKAVEDIGLIKMDFLGLRTLSFLDEAMRILRESGADFEEKYGNFDDIPFDDKATFDLLSRGDTKGVFQLEGAGISDASKRLKPRRLTDIIALSALYRPGPMENIPTYVRRHHGLEEVDYVRDGFPVSAQWLEKILEETYGIPVYQEQIMQIASDVAGYSLGQADLLRRAMGKKIAEEMQKQRVLFVKGAGEKGVPEEEANKLFDLLDAFANYGFNKCLVGNTRIPVAGGGLKTIEEIYNSGQKVNLPSVNAEYKFKLQPTGEFFDNGIKPVFKVKTSLGRELTATGNHPLLTLDGWRNIEDLSIGERIAAPAQLPELGTETWPAHQLGLLGWILAEGNTCHTHGAYLYSQCTEQVADMVALAEQFSNTRPTVKKRADRHDVHDIYLGSGIRGSSAGKSGVRLWLEELELINKKATEKTFPADVFRLKNASLTILIGRYWSGDGFLFSKGNTTPYAATSSKQLAEDLVHLLLRLGIVGKITEKHFRYTRKDDLSGRTGYTVHLVGRRSIEQFIDLVAPHLVGRQQQLQALCEYYASTPSNRESVDTVPASVKTLVQTAKQKSGLTWKEIESSTSVCIKEFYGAPKAHKKGFRRSTIQTLGEFFEDDGLLNSCSDELFWDTIVSIEPAGEAQTYDLEVPQTHNFVANDLVVHNSHSAAYGVISYQTAWLKTHYPVQFMAALLTVERKDSDKVSEYISDARKMDVHVLPPDINRSAPDFAVEGKDVLFGLYAIKGLGENAVKKVLEEREKSGSFKSFADFCSRIDHKTCNRKAIERLIKSGAFDHFGERNQLVASLEETMSWAQGAAAMANSGMDALFGLEETAPEPKLKQGIEAYTELERLKQEKDALGLYISGHPLEQYEGLREAASCRISKLDEWFQSQNVQPGKRTKAVLAGMIESVTKKPTKSGGMMARFILADESGQIELVAFSRAYERIQEKLINDTPALVIVDLESEDGGLRAIAEELVTIEQLDDVPKVMYVNIELENTTPDELGEFQSLLDEHAGSMPTYLRLETLEQFVVYHLDRPTGGNAAMKVINETFNWAEAYLAYDQQTILGRFAPKPPAWMNRKKENGGMSA